MTTSPATLIATYTEDGAWLVVIDCPHAGVALTINCSPPHPPTAEDIAELEAAHRADSAGCGCVAERRRRLGLPAEPTAHRASPATRAERRRAERTQQGGGPRR